MSKINDRIIFLKKKLNNNTASVSLFFSIFFTAIIIFVYNVFYGEKVFSSIYEKYPIVSTAWSPDGEKFVVCTSNEVKMYSKNGDIYNLFGKFYFPYFGNSLGFTEGGRFLVTAWAKNYVGAPDDKIKDPGVFTIWDVSAGTIVKNIYNSDFTYNKNIREARKFVTSSNSSRIAFLASTGFSEKNILIYDYKNKTFNDVDLKSVNSSPPIDFVFSNDGNRIFEGNDGVYSISLKGEGIGVLLKGVDDISGTPISVGSVSVSPGEDLIAASVQDGRQIFREHETPIPPVVRIWAMQSGREIASYSVGVSKLTWSYDEKYLAAASGRNVFLFDVASGAGSISNIRFDEKVSDIKFSPKRNLLLISAGNKASVFSISK